jgi:hypothetical protein
MARPKGSGPTSTSFKKGESGNPAGSKPRDPELQALAREYSVPALRRIISIMENPATEDDTLFSNPRGGLFRAGIEPCVPSKTAISGRLG